MIAKLRFARFGGCCLLLALLSGCATKHPVPVTYTFFPPAPDQPRVQFLTSFSAGIDLGGSGSFVDFITGRPAAPNALIKPYGLAIKDGKIYVCDTVADAVEVFDLVKKRARYFAPRGEGRLLMPINISIDTDGTRYVADTGRSQVVIFDKDGNFLGAIGTRDEMKPCDVAIAADRLYIADLKGHAVRVYDKATRKLLFTIPRDPNAKEGKLFSPTNLALDPQGRLLVSDTGGFAVKVYDLEGKYLRMIGQQGLAPGSFSRPKGVAVDRDGRAYVVDAATQVVQIFDPEGRLLLYFGQPNASTRGELSLPAAVKVDYDNVGLFQKYVAPGHQCEYLILVISQFGTQKVNIYGFLKQSAAP
ncbi:MAG: hypothetical protein WBN75_00705 [Verrucomicrobiia bacterium]|jgi:DNA-binding beta-propeller fold protein YncE